MKELRLLVVEDNEMVSRMLQRVLPRYWKVVVMVKTADEGINELSNRKYDIVLTDWDCPVKGDGKKVVSKCNSLRIPVVVHTGNIELASKLFTVVNKPADIDEINRVLIEAWENK